MTLHRKYIIGIIALLVLAGVVVLRIVISNTGADTRRQNVPIVRIEKPRQETVTYSLQFTGDVVPIQQANIYAKVGGTLERVYVDMGVPVSRGQMLALIDTTELFQTRQQAEATAENARLTFNRTKDLYEQSLVAKQDYENAQATMKVAVAALDVATTRLDYARIVAPFSGIVTRRSLDPGAVVTAMITSLFSLMDLDNMKVVVNILERDIPRITPACEAAITVDAFPGKTFAGKVTRFSQAVDLATRTMPVEIDILNRDHALRPGMFANVTLRVGERPNALTLPTQAFVRDDQGSFVYVARADTARRVRLAAGVEQSGRIEILSGLDGSEDVITTGQQFVRDGGPVVVQKSGHE
jgi:RND family efflux transporter MFP subunit